MTLGKNDKRAPSYLNVRAGGLHSPLGAHETYQSLDARVVVHFPKMTKGAPIDGRSHDRNGLTSGVLVSMAGALVFCGDRDHTSGDFGYGLSVIAEKMAPRRSVAGVHV